MQLESIHVCILNGGSYLLFMRLVSMKFDKINFKNWSYSIIHIFKNYFDTIFLIFCF